VPHFCILPFPRGWRHPEIGSAIGGVNYDADISALIPARCRAPTRVCRKSWRFQLSWCEAASLNGRACHLANLARQRDVALNTLRPRLAARLERCYDAILAEGLAFHEAQAPLAGTPGVRPRRGRKARRTGHNLIRRLIERKQDTLRFLHDAAVPFTNNQAERDGRMMKVKMKISGGFRCQNGADDFAIIRSFISTAKKRGWNVIHALTQEPQSLIASLGPA
jgi:hypothetical protein